MATSRENYSQQQREMQHHEENSSFLNFENNVVLERCPELISYSKMFRNRLHYRKLFTTDFLPVKFETRNVFMKKTKWQPRKRKPFNFSICKMKKSTTLKSKSDFLPILPPVAKYLKQKYKSKKEESAVIASEEQAITTSQEDMTKKYGCVRFDNEDSLEVNNSGQEIIEDNQTKTWNKKDASLLSDLFQRTDFLALTMKDNEESQHFKEETAERVNQSALAIDVKSTKVLPPKTLKDVLNPKVRNTVLHPSNTYQMELLTGVPLKYNPSKKNIIITGTDTQYKKCQQQEYPPPPDEWYPTVSKVTSQRDFEVQKSTAKSLVPKITKFDKGFIRWVALPEVIMDSRTVAIDHFDGMKVEQQSTQTKITTAEKSCMEQILDTWQLKWQLSPGLTNMSVEDVFLNMAALHPNIRCLAVITATKIGIQCKYSASQPNDSLKMIARKNKNGLPNLLDTIISAVQCMLGDTHENVKMAAALGMFCLEQENDKAESVVRACLGSHNLLKRWVAAQCLGHAGYSDSDVISEVIQQTFTSTDMDQVTQGINLLMKLSRQSSLVQSLVAEHLNSSRWQSKVMACQLFSQLHSHISKDISDKIKCLMWSDWHPEVRLQAAHCLGKTKQGKEVHDDLLLKLKHPQSQVRIKAVRLIGHLGVMTRKLALQFLQCFEDCHVSVRCETCITCGKLQLADPDILNKLVDIATHESLWKLKALAIQALGQIGVCSEEIKNCLLWSVHYSNHFAVRAEACRSLRFLKVQSSEVVLTLQERFLVENDPAVKKELQESLMAISGWSPIDETDEVQKVKHAVRMLSTPRSITQHVILMDHWLKSYPQPASLGCSSQVLSGTESSKIKAKTPTSTPLPNERESHTEYPKETAHDEGKLTQQLPSTSKQNTKTKEFTTERRKGKLGEKNQSKDPMDSSRQKVKFENIRFDCSETRLFLTEVHDHMLCQNCMKKESQTEIKNKSDYGTQNLKGIQNLKGVHSMTYKNLIEPLSSFSCDLPKKVETKQDTIHSDLLVGKNKMKQDHFAGCFNKLLVHYTDLFPQTNEFPFDKDY